MFKFLKTNGWALIAGTLIFINVISAANNGYDHEFNLLILDAISTLIWSGILFHEGYQTGRRKMVKDLEMIRKYKESN